MPTSRYSRQAALTNVKKPSDQATRNDPWNEKHDRSAIRVVKLVPFFYPKLGDSEEGNNSIAFSLWHLHMDAPVLADQEIIIYISLRGLWL